MNCVSPKPQNSGPPSPTPRCPQTVAKQLRYAASVDRSELWLCILEKAFLGKNRRFRAAGTGRTYLLTRVRAHARTPYLRLITVYKSLECIFLNPINPKPYISPENMQVFSGLGLGFGIRS